MDDFERALEEVLKDEGGYVNHPKDPGGATNKGVTQRVYDDFRTRNGQPPRSVRSINEAEVAAIYRVSYWNLARCPELPPGVAYFVFDGAVNSGVKQSVKWLQRALGVVDDGVIGPTTIAAAHKAPDKIRLINTMAAKRLAFLKALDGWPTFGRGWSSRVARVERLAVLWSRGKLDKSSPPVAENGNAKALIADVKPAPSAAIGDAMTGAGSAGAILSQSIDQLAPLAANEFVARIVTILTIVSVAIALAGIGWRVYANWRKAKIAEALT